jgi:tetratricopeptide (TPR) repeat protein
MNVARRLIALVLVASGAYAFYLFCYLPYRCNLIKKSTTLSTEDAYAHIGTPEGSIKARRNLSALRTCLNLGCRDVSSEMIAAANYRVLGRNDEAIRLYREALRLDPRPELYVNLGAAELAAGDRDAARDDALSGALFSPFSVRFIEDGQLRQEVVERLITLRPENEKYIREVAATPLN